MCAFDPENRALSYDLVCCSVNILFLFRKKYQEVKTRIAVNCYIRSSSYKFNIENSYGLTKFILAFNAGSNSFYFNNLMNFVC